MSLSQPTVPFGPAPKSVIDLKVSDLLSPGTAEWNRDLIAKLFTEHMAEILLLKPSKFGAQDKWVWLPTDSGVYNAKSGYFEALKSEPSPQETEQSLRGFNWKSDIWSLKSSPKTKLLMWKAMQNTLPVGENLKQRNINPTAQCPHCGENETVEHLFFSCTFATLVWNLAPCKHSLNLSRISNCREGIEASKSLICLPPTGITDGPIAPWLLWAIWNARNQLIFNQLRTHPFEVTLQAIIRAKEWQSSQIEKTLPPPKQLRPRISALPPDRIVCNTDAAWKNDFSAGFGWVFSILGRQINLGSASAQQIRSPLVAEAMAMIHAINHALTLGFRQIQFASDSSQLIKALNSEIQSKELHGIQHDILTLSCNFDFIAFSFTHRASNSIADSIAKEALCNASVL